MSDLRAIADELARAARSGERIVLASVVRAEGATYRGVGARMVIRDDDTTVGLLSGGCLEGDLVAHARRVRDTDRAATFSYDGRARSTIDDSVWGFGTGCNGLVEVFLEPCTSERAGALAALLCTALEGDSPSVIVTVVGAQGGGAPNAGARALVCDGAVIAIDGDWGSGELLRAVSGDAAHTPPGTRRGLILDYVANAGAGLQVVLESILPAIDLVICGSGPDVIPAARIATALGWTVTIVDPRPVALTPPARFGTARVVECAHSEQLASAVALSPRTASIIMSHNFERDLDYLDALAASNVAYIGVLGPRARTDQLLADLAMRGRPCPAEMLARVYAPVGLDLGGDGAEAIALSIVSQLSAVMHGRAAGHLRESASAIHDATVPA